MSTLGRKYGAKRALYSIPSLVILAVIAIILIKGTVGVLHKERSSRESATDLKEKETALILREGDLREKISRLETEKGIQEEIRERFSVAQDGELVAVIVDDQKVSSSTENSVLPWYKRFWFAIIGE